MPLRTEWSLLLYAVIDDGITFSCNNRSRDSRCLLLVWTSGNPKNCHSPLRDLNPHLIHGLLGPSESDPKRHLDRFSRFCRAHERDEQTHKPRYSVCSNRPHLYVLLRCDLITASARLLQPTAMRHVVKIVCPFVSVIDVKLHTAVHIKTKMYVSK